MAIREKQVLQESKDRPDPLDLQVRRVTMECKDLKVRWDLLEFKVLEDPEATKARRGIPVPLARQELNEDLEEKLGPRDLRERALFCTRMISSKTPCATLNWENLSVACYNSIRVTVTPTRKRLP